MDDFYAVWVQRGLVGIVELVDHPTDGETMTNLIEEGKETSLEVSEGGEECALQVMDFSLLSAQDRSRMWALIDKVLFTEQPPHFHADLPIFPPTGELKAELADLCGTIKRRAKELGIPPWL